MHRVAGGFWATSASHWLVTPVGPLVPPGTFTLKQPNRENTDFGTLKLCLKLCFQKLHVCPNSCCLSLSYTYLDFVVSGVMDWWCSNKSSPLPFNRHLTWHFGMDDVRGWAWYANKVQPTFPNQASTRILKYTFPTRIPGPHLGYTNTALPQMGLNRIPAGILIRARLLRLKAGRIPSFIRGQKGERGSVGKSVGGGSVSTSWGWLFHQNWTKGQLFGNFWATSRPQ